MNITDKDLKAFADGLLKVARTIHKAKDDRSFGDQVFIYPVRKVYAPRMSKDHFDDLLMMVARKGLVRLNRADLVAAMPFEMVQKSETRYINATFHLIEV